MPILDISRDWGVNPSIVRILSSDTLAQTLATGYLRASAQTTAIAALNNGAFSWDASDQVLINYAGGAGFFDHNMTNDALTLNDPTVATVAMTAAQWNGMFAAPVQIVAAPGAGLIILPSSVSYSMTFVAAQYAAGGVVNLQYANTANGNGSAVTQDIAAATINGLAASSVVRPPIAITSLATNAAVNLGLFMSNKTAAFTTGDGTWLISVAYRIIAA